MASKHTKFYGVEVRPRDLVPDVSGPAGTPTFVPMRVEANPALVTSGGDVMVISDQTKPTPLVLLGFDVVGNRVGIGVPRIAHGIYSFAVDAGATGLVTPVKTANIPANAIIYGGWANPTTAPTSGGSATIGFGTSAGSSATSLLAQTAVASFTLDALIALIPTLAVPIKLTAAGNLTMTIAAATLTAGIIELFVLYTVATNA